jgi:hypothetical protein
MQEFLELKLGNMTMDEYERKFLKLLGYVDSSRMRRLKYKYFLVGYFISIVIKFILMSPTT